jgi:hypothetical protein
MELVTILNCNLTYAKNKSSYSVHIQWSRDFILIRVVHLIGHLEKLCQEIKSVYFEGFANVFAFEIIPNNVR